MNEAIKLALKTWYPEDHPLHLNPEHPAIKLAGEAGEVLDLYGKHMYKPGFGWWDCKHCGKIEEDHFNNKYTEKIECFEDHHLEKEYYYTPLVLDELGDLWYYLRILAYQSDCKLNDFSTISSAEILLSLSSINSWAAKFLMDYLDHQHTNHELLKLIYWQLNNTLIKLGTTLDQLTELNYIKLNSDPTNHGWKDA